MTFFFLAKEKRRVFFKEKPFEKTLSSFLRVSAHY